MSDRQIVLMETNNNQVTLTRFHPGTVLHRVYYADDRVVEYTVQDLLDEVAKANPEIPLPVGMAPIGPVEYVSPRKRGY